MSKSTSSGTYIIDQEYHIVDYNQTAKELYPMLKKGEKCYKMLMGLEEPCGPCPVANGIKGPRTYMDPIRKIAETVDAVEIPLADGSIGHALVFSTVGQSATLAATLPKSPLELKNLSLLKGFTTDYYDVYTLEISTGEITIVRQSGEAIGIEAGFQQKLEYGPLMDLYICNNIHPEDQERMREQLELDYVQNQLQKKEYVTYHYRVYRGEEIHYFNLKIVRIGEADSYEHLLYGFACEDEDILERMRVLALRKTVNELELDSATGLYTKNAFYYHANMLLQGDKEVNYDIILMKLNNLSVINHQRGRMTGNQVLRDIAKSLHIFASNQIQIAYLEEGKFISISPHKFYEERMEEIKGFRQQLRDSCDVKNLNLKFVIYPYIDRKITVEESADKARAALEMIRYNNSCDILLFDQKIARQLDMEEQLESDFDTALRENQIKVWFQPKYDCKTKKIIGAEALARWIKEDGSMISPAQFIPVLEKSGDIYRLDYYIFSKVCAFHKFLEDSMMPKLPISVNVSRASIYNEESAKEYAIMADYYKVEKSYIPLEITESEGLHTHTIQEYALNFVQNGFQLHMDDFGAGYSSLASLQDLPFETIKIDKSLVDFIGTEGGESLLRHTIAYAKENGLSVVAEGVEDAEQYWFLKAVGCDSIQGYYFSKPVDEDTFLKMIMEKPVADLQKGRIMEEMNEMEFDQLKAKKRVELCKHPHVVQLHYCGMHSNYGCTECKMKSLDLRKFRR